MKSPLSPARTRYHLLYISSPPAFILSRLARSAPESPPFPFPRLVIMLKLKLLFPSKKKVAVLKSHKLVLYSTAIAISASCISRNCTDIHCS